MRTKVLIMAAGQGTRMQSRLAKVLHPLCGRPLLLWPVLAAQRYGAEKTVVVSDGSAELAAALPADVAVAVQQEPRGTGDAVRSALEYVEADDQVVVLSADHPLVSEDLIAELVATHSRDQAVATLVSTDLGDPTGYGRIVRDSDGNFERVVETKLPGDASETELQLSEINTGTYCFHGETLMRELARLTGHNAQGELYLGDVLAALVEQGDQVSVLYREDSRFALGVNTRVDLAKVRSAAQQMIIERHMLAGVTVVDPTSTSIDVEVEIGPDTTVEPFSSLRGSTFIGEQATVGPAATLVDATVGDRSEVVHSYLEDCEVMTDCRVGPFSYLRPQSKLCQSAKVGTFVEVKNSVIGAGSKVPHLSYIGDASIGADTNIGAGNITANYDGRRKHRTVIGERVHTGVDTSFVAPVNVGSDAYTGAGSTITEDVPDGALAVARTRQKNIENYAATVDSQADGDRVH